MKKLLISFLLLLFIIAFPINSLEIKDGKIKLQIHEDTGRYSLFYLTDINKNVFRPLFFAQDTRTSYFNVLMGNKTYTLGETSFFRHTIKKTPNGAQITWKSNQILITQDFSFVRSSESALSDGIKITINTQNTSSSKKEFGLRYVLDTFLGEDEGIHFSLDDKTEIISETAFDRDNMPKFWTSIEKDKDESFGFLGMLKGKDITRPDKVVFANWKRLSDSSWAYNEKSTRNFNFLPHSINDSSVCYYFDPVILEKDNSRTITIVLGKDSEEGFALGETDSVKNITEIFQKARESGYENNTETAIRTDIIAVNDLVNQIDRIIENSENITDEEVDVLNQLLEELKKRKQDILVE